MATTYLRSTDGLDVDDGSTWALADATLAAALTAAGASGRVYVSQAHAETGGATLTLTSSGAAGTVTEVICGNDAAEPPTAVATTATVSASTAINFSGFAHYYGISFTSTSASGSLTTMVLCSNNAASGWSSFDTCSFTAGSGATQRIALAFGGASTADDQRFTAVNCSFKFGAVGQALIPVGHNTIVGGSFAPTGSVPTALFSPAADRFFSLDVRGADISTLGSGKSLVDVSVASSSGYARFVDCKLGASVSVTTGTHIGQGGVTVELINCDSSDPSTAGYRYVKVDYQGEVRNETTIKRTGGANDNNTGGFSRRMESSANTRFFNPLCGPWFKFWNETTGSAVDVAIEVVTDNVTLDDDEAWIEVEALTNSGYPYASITTDRAADILATPAAQTSSSETWTTTGLTTPVKQKLSTQVTPQEKGWIRARVCLAKASTTLYACPKIKSDSAYQWMDETGAVVNSPAASSGSGGGPLIGPGRLVRA